MVLIARASLFGATDLIPRSVLLAVDESSVPSLLRIFFQNEDWNENKARSREHNRRGLYSCLSGVGAEHEPSAAEATLERGEEQKSKRVGFI